MSWSLFIFRGPQAQESASVAREGGQGDLFYNERQDRVKGKYKDEDGLHNAHCRSHVELELRVTCWNSALDWMLKKKPHLKACMLTLLEKQSKHACLHYWRKINKSKHACLHCRKKIQSMHAYTARKNSKHTYLHCLKKNSKHTCLHWWNKPQSMKQTSKNICLHCWKRNPKRAFNLHTHTEPHIHKTHTKAYRRKQPTKFVLTHLRHNCLCPFLHLVTLICLLLDLVVARGEGLHGIGPDHQLTGVRVKATWGGHWHKVCHQGFVTWGRENAAWNGC